MIVNLYSWKENLDVILYCYAQGYKNNSIAIFCFENLTLHKNFQQVCHLQKRFLQECHPPHHFYFDLDEMVFQNLSKKNQPFGKESSTLVSDIIKISILSAKEPSFFRIELIFRCAKISLYKIILLSLQNHCKN